MADVTAAQRWGGILNWVRGCWSPLWALEARRKGARLEGRQQFSGRPLISVAAGSTLHLGDGVILNSALRSNPLGCAQPCVLRTLAADAELVLGRDVGLSATVLCAMKSIRVGEGTQFGAGVLVLDNDFHRPADDWRWAEALPGSARPVVIGRGVFVGARAIILKGVTIGDRAVIGAGAVVTRDVPARHRAVGNPARVTELPGEFFAGMRDS